MAMAERLVILVLFKGFQCVILEEKEPIATTRNSPADVCYFCQGHESCSILLHKVEKKVGRPEIPPPFPADVAGALSPFVHRFSFFVFLLLLFFDLLLFDLLSRTEQAQAATFIPEFSLRANEYSKFIATRVLVR